MGNGELFALTTNPHIYLTYHSSMILLSLVTQVFTIIQTVELFCDVSGKKLNFTKSHVSWST